MDKNSAAPETRGISFDDIYLVSLEYKANHHYQKKKLTIPDFHVEYNYQKFKIQDKYELVCRMHFSFDSDTREDPFVLHAVYEWHYTYKNPEIKIDDFAGNVAPAHAVSYFRELVSNITGRSVFPAYYLPLINISRLLRANSAPIPNQQKSKSTKTTKKKKSLKKT